VSPPAQLPCPACGSKEAKPLLELHGLPVMCGALWSSRAEAESAAFGDMQLVACPECSMLRNAAFDSGLVDYDASYDNSLHWSPTFQHYADELAHRLVERYRLASGTVVEIGSGKGDFLRMICGLSGSRGWGYDPAYDGEQEGQADQVTFVSEYFTGKLPIVPDLVCARHVLEHLATPAELLAAVGQSAGTNTVLYAEVPNAANVLTPAGLWDLIYPHVGYFTAAALRHLMNRCGFRPLEVATSFGDQYLYVEAQASPQAAAPPPEGQEVEAVLAQASTFADLHRSTVARWADVLAQARQAGQRPALWGVGTKGATFLNTVPGGREVADVVDVNPRKHGRFVPRTGQKVIGPDELKATRPDLVLVMNPLYEAEIRRSLAELDLHPTVMVV
jgi:hypothetical protein